MVILICPPPPHLASFLIADVVLYKYCRFLMTIFVLDYGQKMV